MITLKIGKFEILSVDVLTSRDLAASEPNNLVVLPYRVSLGNICRGNLVPAWNNPSWNNVFPGYRHAWDQVRSGDNNVVTCTEPYGHRLRFHGDTCALAHLTFVGIADRSSTIIVTCFSHFILLLRCIDVDHRCIQMSAKRYCRRVRISGQQSVDNILVLSKRSRPRALQTTR